MSLETGQIVEGKYRIIRLLGEGGMGAVYEGENIRIHRKVAIKVLHAGVAENKDAVARFEREAQAAGRIGSDHIVEVLDLGSLPDGDRFMVMEYMDGESLNGRIESRGKLTPQEISPIMVQMLEGLQAAHGAGIIHRDLKPDNVYLIRAKKGQADFCKILDFGISKFSALSSDSGMSMTRTGAVMGTPFYMSPEQAKGAKDMDHRSDLYSAGVILYQAVTGQVPFNAETFNELIFKIVLEAPPPPEQFVPDLDPSFSTIIRKSMARDPADRFQTADEFAQAFRGWLGTGKGVSVAPPASAVYGAPAGAGKALGSTATAQPLGKTGTPAPWANTGAGLAAEELTGLPKKANTGMMIGIAAAALLVLGGGAFVGVSVLGKKGPAAPPVAAAAAPAPLPAAAAPAPTVALAAPAPAAPSAETAPVAAAPLGAAGKKPAAPAGALPLAAKHPAAAAPAPAPAAAAAPSPTAGGRRIHTEL